MSWGKKQIGHRSWRSWGIVRKQREQDRRFANDRAEAEDGCQVDQHPAGFRRGRAFNAAAAITSLLALLVASPHQAARTPLANERAVLRCLLSSPKHVQWKPPAAMPTPTTAADAEAIVLVRNNKNVILVDYPNLLLGPAEIDITFYKNTAATKSASPIYQQLAHDLRKRGASLATAKVDGPSVLFTAIPLQLKSNSRSLLQAVAAEQRLLVGCLNVTTR